MFFSKEQVLEILSENNRRYTAIAVGGVPSQEQLIDQWVKYNWQRTVKVTVFDVTEDESPLFIGGTP